MMQVKLFLTELRLFKLSHFGQLVYGFMEVWSLRNQLLPQFSVDIFNHTFILWT